MSEHDMPPQSESASLIAYRLAQIEKTLSSLVEQNARIIAIEQRMLEMREAQDRAFKSIKDSDGRIRTIETEMPTLRLVRGWVIAGMLAVIAASGTVVLDTVRKAGQPPVTQPARTG